MTSAETGPPMTSNRVYFVNKDYARSVLFTLDEEIPYPRSTHTNEHLDEIGTRDREEWHSGLAGNRACQKRLSGPRWSDQQNTLWDPPAETGKAFRILKELDYLLQLILGFIDSCNIGERNLMSVLGEQLGPALTK